MSHSYEVATDLATALEVLSCEQERAYPLAGGTDLIPGVRAGQVAAGVLLDISRLDVLRGVHASPSAISIGSLTTAAALARSDVVRTRLPSLASAARGLGSPQIRNRATIGGNVMNASPAGDMLVALVGLGATVRLASRRGERSVPLDDFVLGPGLTRRGPDELVLGFDLPVHERQRSRYHKVGLRRSLACAVCSVSVMVVRGDSGASPGSPTGFSDARIALGAVGPTPVRARAAERALLAGASPREVAEEAGGACAPIGDVRASAAYRRHLVRVWTERIVGEMMGEGEGGS